MLCWCCHVSFQPFILQESCYFPFVEAYVFFPYLHKVNLLFVFFFSCCKLLILLLLFSCCLMYVRKSCVTLYYMVNLTYAISKFKVLRNAVTIFCIWNMPLRSLHMWRYTITHHLRPFESKVYLYSRSVSHRDKNAPLAILSFCLSNSKLIPDNTNLSRLCIAGVPVIGLGSFSLRAIELGWSICLGCGSSGWHWSNWYFHWFRLGKGHIWKKQLYK